MRQRILCVDADSLTRLFIPKERCSLFLLVWEIKDLSLSMGLDGNICKAAVLRYTLFNAFMVLGMTCFFRRWL